MVSISLLGLALPCPSPSLSILQTQGYLSCFKHIDFCWNRGGNGEERRECNICRVKGWDEQVIPVESWLERRIEGIHLNYQRLMDMERRSARHTGVNEIKTRETEQRKNVWCIYRFWLVLTLLQHSQQVGLKVNFIPSVFFDSWGLLKCSRGLVKHTKHDG